MHLKPSVQMLTYLVTVNYLYLISFTGYQSYGRSSPFSTVSDYTYDLARQIGMEQCGQMAICDAHARYSDYGLLALPLILLFPG